MYKSLNIYTERLYLRPIKSEDAAAYAELLSDPTVHPFVTEQGPPQNIAVLLAQKQMDLLQKKSLTLSICFEESFVGYVSVHQWQQIRPAISYAISPCFQKRGFAREALQGLLHALPHDGVRKLVAQTHFDNIASVNLLLAVGFEEQASTLTRRVFHWHA